MSRRFVVAIAAVLLAVLGTVGHIQAGGGPFNTLTFPGAYGPYCGRWQAGGVGGQGTPNWFAVYTVNDADGHLLSFGILTRLPTDGKLTGWFNRRPTRNPINFTATAFYQGQLYNIGNLYADDPCLATSSTRTPVASPTTTLPPTATLPAPILTPPSIVELKCDSLVVAGDVPSYTPTVRVEVALSSNLSVKLGSVVVRPENGKYHAQVDFPTQVDQTALVISVGAWNGQKYMSPAVIFGRNCSAPKASPTAIMPTPTTVLPTPTLPSPILVPPSTVELRCDSLLVAGSVPTNVPYVRVEVTLASNLAVKGGAAIVRPENGSYRTTLYFLQQLPQTHMIISVGAWDGQKYMSPAILLGRDCLPATNAPPTVNIGCDQTTIEVHGPKMNAELASIMRSQVVNADTNTVLAVKNVSLPDDPPYTITLIYPAQTVGTRINVAMFLWNGVNVVGRAEVFQGECHPKATATPIPTVVPSPIPTAFDAPPTVTFGCSQTVIQVHGPKMVNPVAPYMRSQTINATSNTVLAFKDVALPDNPPYTIVLNYPTQPAGTLLNVAMFQWTGSASASPAAIYSGNCQ